MQQLSLSLVHMPVGTSQGETSYRQLEHPGGREAMQTTQVDWVGVRTTQAAEVWDKRRNW